MFPGCMMCAPTGGMIRMYIYGGIAIKICSPYSKIARP